MKNKTYCLCLLSCLLLLANSGSVVQAAPAKSDKPASTPAKTTPSPVSTNTLDKPTTVKLPPKVEPVTTPTVLPKTITLPNTCMDQPGTDHADFSLRSTLVDPQGGVVEFDLDGGMYESLDLNIPAVLQTPYEDMLHRAHMRIPDGGQWSESKPYMTIRTDTVDEACPTATFQFQFQFSVPDYSPLQSPQVLSGQRQGNSNTCTYQFNSIAIDGFMAHRGNAIPDDSLVGAFCASNSNKTWKGFFDLYFYYFPDKTAQGIPHNIRIKGRKTYPLNDTYIVNGRPFFR